MKDDLKKIKFKYENVTHTKFIDKDDILTIKKKDNLTRTLKLTN